jgi:hypothetical protein
MCQDPCGDLGDDCSVNSECCSRTCLGGKCVYSSCGATGSTCTANSNCCSDLCTAGTCE